MKLKDYSMIIEIEIKREDLYKSVMDKGMNHPSTLQISRELDQLLNQFSKLNKR
jgi:Spo0E like sporulation regulatory protein